MKHTTKRIGRPAKGFAEERMFSGIRYTLWHEYGSKTKASNTAKFLRNEGWLVRLASKDRVGWGTTYAVYTRPRAIK